MGDFEYLNQLPPELRKALETSTAGGGSMPSLPFFVLSDYAAVGDGVADDGPAFNRALADMVSQKRGARLIVPPRRADGSLARYRIGTQVAVDAGTGSSDGLYTIQFDGSIILSDVGSAGSDGTIANNIAFQFTNFNSLVIDHLQAYGVYPGFNIAANPNCDIFLQANGSNMHLRDCWLAGIICAVDTGQANYLTPRAPICSLHSDLSWHNLRIAACGPASVIFCDDWDTVCGNESAYFDFYDIDGTVYAPAGPAQVLLVGQPHDELAFTNRVVDIRNWTSDEGAGLAILARPTSYPGGNRIHFLNFENFNVLGNAGVSANVIEVVNCDFVRMKGFVQRLQNIFTSVGTRVIELDGVLCDAGSTPINNAISDGGTIVARNCVKNDGTSWASTLIGSGASQVIIEDKGGGRQVPQVSSTGALPTPGPAFRGMIYLVDGAPAAPGPGSADVAYICLKAANDTYAWHAISVT